VARSSIVVSAPTAVAPNQGDGRRPLTGAVGGARLSRAPLTPRGAVADVHVGKRSRRRRARGRMVAEVDRGIVVSRRPGHASAQAFVLAAASEVRGRREYRRFRADQG